ncbi:ATP-dependent protease LonB [Salipaludibacillus agaradhaerens]|uniref:ATP-dependent protease LonB n=1 Tax=Salipaludibacillus agaradhaerens TaxID=76935 RepID=UPI00215086E2|nr:ATP-dependent protease LonB [Salipaludibacillus agaradhaerens]MCR6107476.1 ATP-dependent protease LonB [Salipaludibacillus agaradhaerens]MCR6119505.1 ATP-dependent protease LonB [Salipaludibacillus agaradhaerens]
MTITGMMVLIQLFFGVVIGLYFWNLLKSQHTQRRSVDKESQKEMDQLRRMRKIKLTEPLSERVRPKNFADIVGQSHGIRSLQAAICGPNPQHVIIYGPPGVGKTAAARLVLEEAKANPNSPFRFDSVFVELDGATARFDERGIADPLIGSVHDPIYQGAGAMGQAGIPQPKQGAVTKAHGGILFIDEIGELHSIQINKLLKVLEERRVFLESAYYHEENPQIPEHIHDIFKKGLPADFRLIAATTRHPEEIPPAIRSRCVEVFFRGLTQEEVRKVAAKSVDKLGMDVESTVYDQVASYATNGREAVNMVQLAAAMAINEGRQNVRIVDLEWVIHAGQMSPRMEKRISSIDKIGAVNGLAVSGPGAGMLLEVEVTALKRAAGGGLIVTGIADEESTGNQMRSVKRKSMARSSVENVVTVLKHMGIKTDQYDLHVNFPGGVPVDGPSAGIAIATAIYSAIHRIPVSHHIAMTGEIGIYGDVKPVGGVVTKVEAAKYAGVSEVIIPKENNQMVLQDVEGITVFPVENLKEVFDKALKVTEINREEIQDTLLNSFSLLDKEGSIG